MGIRKGWESHSAELQLAPEQLSPVVRALSAEGWHVEADGKLYRTAGQVRIRSTRASIGSARRRRRVWRQPVSLPKLLRAIKQGEQTVRLDDGSTGIIPEEWLTKYGLLANLGSASGEHLRFTRPQAGLLDALSPMNRKSKSMSCSRGCAKS